MGLFAYPLKRYALNNPGGGETWTRVTLGSNFTNTTQDTFEEATGLRLSNLTAGVYSVRVFLSATNTSGANATSWDVDFGNAEDAGSVNAVVIGQVITHGDGSNYAGNPFNANPSPEITPNLGISNGNSQRLLVEMIMALNATVPVLDVRQQTVGASALVTLLAGSYVEYIKRT